MSKVSRWRHRGARLWGDDHKTGAARDRYRELVKPHSHPADRPACPHCHAQGTRINKNGIRQSGPYEGIQIWRCFDCRKDFHAPEERAARDTPDVCPSCGSDHLEKENDGTLVCWRCSWFR